MPHIAIDVLVIGAGAAGMYAAIAAAEAGASVLLVDKSLVGRGGATIMAQMTVSVALGEQGPDDWEAHLADTIKAGRGVCDEQLSALLCQGAPDRIRELDAWNVGWARDGDGRVSAVDAPGHSARRCVYVDFLNTGPAIAQTMRTRVARTKGITKISGLSIRDLVVHDGTVVGAVGVYVNDGTVVTIEARATVLAAGGLTKLYHRNSASTNMGGDAYAIALRAGATLVDMEFPQFFPIGHLAPRLVGMDPIMWDPFRYKLGGKLLNGRMEEFIETYGATDGGVYTTPRDLTSYAITKEVEAGRGSPAGGAYLSFSHVPEQQLRDAFGPVIDLLLENGIDLRDRPVEVAPIAHYHMGGIRVGPDMASTVPGLFAAGEAVGGANGANRLSGNALTEAVVFGHRAGVSAADAARAADPAWSDAAARPILDLLAQVDARAQAGGAGKSAATGKLWQELKELMWANVGLQRTEASLETALARIAEFKAALPTLELTPGAVFNTTVEDWFDLRSSIAIAEVVARAALNRTESRGAHQRLDYPETVASFEKNQLVRQADDGLETQWVPVRRYKAPQRSALEGAAR